MENEQDFLRKLRARFGEGLPTDIVGIGDDAAVIERGDGLGSEAGAMSWVVTTDMLVENVDFLRSNSAASFGSSAESIGFKALAVSLSDIAAMGAEARFAFVSLGVPKDLPDSWVRDFYTGFEEAMLPARVLLLGGDTSRTPAHIVVNVCVIGEAPTREVKLRSGGRPGDILFVTGSLGDAAAGLELLLDGRAGKDTSFLGTRDGHALLGRLERPRAQLNEGRRLGTHAGVSALMDVSDGLAADLPKLLEASGCGARVELSQVPYSPELRTWARVRARDVLQTAAQGGEDFVLLGACRPAAWDALCADFRQAFGREPTRIGELSTGSAIDWQRDGKPTAAPKPGFEHFR